LRRLGQAGGRPGAGDPIAHSRETEVKSTPCEFATAAEVEAGHWSLYLAAWWLAGGKRLFEGVPLGKGHPFIHGSREGESNLAAGVSRWDHRERLSEAGMVDLLGMFRRRPAKRPAGFGRSREDITTLGDSFGDMLSQPLRDAPPIARDGA